MPPRQPASNFVELNYTWREHVEDLVTSRQFSNFIYAVIALSFSLVCVSYAPSQSAQFSSTYTQRVSIANAQVDDASRLGRLQHGFFPPIELQRFPISANSTMRKQYAKLARLYLNPFRKGIDREDYMGAFMRQDTCEGCFLVQVKNGRLYVHDPRGVRALMAKFRELRMREALFWIRNAVERGVIENLEMVVSTTDGVVSSSKRHEYRMPQPEKSTPVFTVVRCNVSDNIPFPMVLVDVLRRGLGQKSWKARELLKQWDDVVVEMGKVNEREISWGEKVSTAVFRGSLRVSAMLKKVKDYSLFCSEIGRSGLWHKAKHHERLMEQYDWKQGLRRRIWPFPTSWFVTKTEAVLDVRLSGSCGDRIFVSDGMSMKEQNLYKYVIHAEGNSFWADRLLLQMFGSSAVMKQETPCGMFFESLLQPYVHYIPVDFRFEQLAVQTLWARVNDRKTREIVRNARVFAGEFLSMAGVQTYVDELLGQYGRLMKKNEIQIERGAVQLYP